MSPRHRRSLFREVNESIRHVASEFSVASRTLELFCECEQPECAERIRVPVDAYTAARSTARYVVAAGHEVAGEYVVGGSAGFSLVSAAVPRPHLRVA